MAEIAHVVQAHEKYRGRFPVAENGLVGGRGPDVYCKWRPHRGKRASGQRAIAKQAGLAQAGCVISSQRCVQGRRGRLALIAARDHILQVGHVLLLGQIQEQCLLPRQNGGEASFPRGVDW